MIPFVDERIKHVGVSELRRINVSALRELAAPIVVHDHCEPIAVIVPYAQFIEMQGLNAVAAVDPAWDEWKPGRIFP